MLNSIIMKKILFSLLLMSLFSFVVSAQKVESDDIEMKFNTAGDTLIIHILDKNVSEFDIFVYKSSEEVKLDVHTRQNPIFINISDWTRGIYHIKIDYNLVTQFRNIEIFE
jgi:ABC-type molybdate transport system ATPase subunit